MLVLSRKVGERIVVGGKVVVTVVRMGQGSVRIGIDAPTEMAIVREELLGDDVPEVSQQPELCDVAAGL